MKLATHLRIDRTLCGEVRELGEGFAKVVLETTQKMAADDRGLVHGGFTFGAADFAAMAAVNDPFVVLVAAEVKFLAPVVVGDEVEFHASVIEKEGKKAKVKVNGQVGDKEVFTGLFATYTPSKHILDR
jgi:acyl-coenzyme A thioesterase PaaI-like protein